MHLRSVALSREGELGSNVIAETSGLRSNPRRERGEGRVWRGLELKTNQRGLNEAMNGVVLEFWMRDSLSKGADCLDKLEYRFAEFRGLSVVHYKVFSVCLRLPRNW